MALQRDFVGISCTSFALSKTTCAQLSWFKHIRFQFTSWLTFYLNPGIRLKSSKAWIQFPYVNKLAKVCFFLHEFRHWYNLFYQKCRLVLSYVYTCIITSACTISTFKILNKYLQLSMSHKFLNAKGKQTNFLLSHGFAFEPSKQYTNSGQKFCTFSHTVLI